MRTFFRHSMAYALITLSIGTFTACDSNSSKKSSSSTSSSLSSQQTFSSIDAAYFGEFQVQFPPNYSHTAASEITLRGVALEADTNSELIINGEIVNSSDLSTWQMPLPLTVGQNDIELTYTNGDGEETSKMWTVYRDVQINSADGLVQDPDTGIFYAMDTNLSSIFIVDAATQQSHLFSPPLDSDVENLLDKPDAIILDPERNRLIVAQNSDNPFIAIDLETREQSVLSVTLPSDVEVLGYPTALAVSGNRMFVGDREKVYVDAQGKRVDSPATTDAQDEDDEPLSVTVPLLYEVDLASLSATTLYKDPQPLKIADDGLRLLTNLEIGEVSKLQFDESRNMLLFVDLIGSTLGAGKFYLDDQKFTPFVLFDENNVILEDPIITGLALTPDNSAVYIGTVKNSDDDSFTIPSIHRIGLSEFTYKIIASPTIPTEQTFSIYDQTHLLLDQESNSIRYYDNTRDQLVNVDIESGERTLMGENTATPLIEVSDFQFDYLQNRLIVSDRLAGSLFSLDQNYEKLILASRADSAPPEDSDEINPIGFPRTFLYRPDESILSFSTGMETLLTKPAESEGYTPQILATKNKITPLDTVFDNNTGYAYLLGLQSGSYWAIYRLMSATVDGIKLERLSYVNIPSPDFPFATPTAMAIDASNGRLLVTDAGRNALLSVDISSGERSYLSGYGTTEVNGDTIEIDQPNAIAMDSKNQIAYVADNAKQAIIQIDTETGAKSLWLDLSAQEVPGLYTPERLKLHEHFQYLLSFDSYSKQLIAIDIPTQQIVRLLR